MKPRLVKCYECKGDGKVPWVNNYNGKEYWAICDECFGEGVINDPDEFVNTLDDLVTSKERVYEND